MSSFLVTVCKGFYKIYNLYEDFYKDSMGLLIFSMQHLILSSSLSAGMVGHLKNAALLIIFWVT